MTDPAVLRRLAQARAYAVKMMPYSAAMIYALVPVAVPGCKTMFVTDRLVMGYDPEFVLDNPYERVGTALAHEAQHSTRNTLNRIRISGMTDSGLANIAADIPINDDLRIAGLDVGDTWVFSSTYGLDRGKTMEEYYQILLKIKKNGNLPQSGTGVGSGQCGGGAGNPFDKGIEDALNQQYGRSPIDVKVKQKQAAADLQKYKNTGRGNCSADLAEALGALAGEAKINWRDIIAYELQMTFARLIAGGMDYSMIRPSTRTFVRDEDIVSPGLVAYHPEVWVVQDTSGSMGTKEIGTSFREIAGLIENLGVTEVTYTEADADVTCQPKKVTVHDLSRMEITGRGGTDFRPAIEFAKQADPPPDVLIYFTDGDGPAPDLPPEFQVVWCVVDSYHKQAPAEWGTTVFIED